MKELLVMSPRLPPYNGADAQRVRVMLPHLARHGWRATVLAATADSEAGTPDAELEATCRDLDVTWCRVPAWPRRTASRFGIRQHMLRAWWPWRRAIARLRGQRRFDAVFVSTTDFALWPLALRAGAPIVLDWQDPWRSDYHDRNPSAPAPGGRLRYAAMQAYAKWQEPRVARAAAAHVVVSPTYVTMLRERYPDLAEDRFTVLPFAAGARDRELALATGSATLPAARRRWWVSIGRGGKDLHFALGGLFDALRRARAVDPGRHADLGLLFIGTAYEAHDKREEIAALAREHGVGDMVIEQPARIGLLETYRVMEAAEAIVVPGSDDPGYMASKLAPSLLAGKPLLAILHAQSPALRLAHAHAATRFVAFDPAVPDARARLVDAIDTTWLDPGVPARATADVGELEAAAMTARLCAVFDRAVRA